jgi:excisionase family DNA binding protein
LKADRVDYAASPALEPALGALSDNLGLMTVENLAAALGKAPQTIRNWVAQRRIPFVPGRPVMFRRASIEAWLEKQEIKPCQ